MAGPCGCRQAHPTGATPPVRTQRGGRERGWVEACGSQGSPGELSADETASDLDVRGTLAATTLGRPEC